MRQVRVQKVDGRTFFPDKAVDALFNVEASDGDGRWTTVSTHLSPDGAEKKRESLINYLQE